jgi:hypothetical protein
MGAGSRISFFVCILSVCLSSAAPADDYPTVLYNWAKLRTLQRLEQENQAHDGLPLDWIPGNHRLGEAWPALGGRRALYAWSHPVTGLASGPEEIYGAEVLTKIRLKPDARWAELHSREGETSYDLGFRLESVDVIKHTYQFQNGERYSEYVIVNPRAVEEYSALPEASRPELERELSRLRDTNYRYSQNQIHKPGPDSIFNDPRWRPRILDFLESFLNHDVGSLPDRYRKPFANSQETCELHYRTASAIRHSSGAPIRVEPGSSGRIGNVSVPPARFEAGSPGRRGRQP